MGTKYQLNVVNNAPEDTLDFCVFQKPPAGGPPDVRSLAWLVKKAHPGTTMAFTWTIDYSFIWADTGPLLPGVVFTASEHQPADPTSDTANQIHFDYVDDAYEFSQGAVPGAAKGGLYIKESGAIPPGSSASVGIGMSGSGTFAVQARPNMTAAFIPHPNYWISAGTFTKGAVIDIDVVTDVQPVNFPEGVYIMTATLDNENRWTVTQGPPPGQAARETHRR
jgi:hypothetical protein